MGVTRKMTRMVLLCMLILSMVSLPTSLARKECTDFLEEALDVLGNAYKTMGPDLLEGMKAVMENRIKERITDVSRPHVHIHLVHVHHLLRVIGRLRGVYRNMADYMSLLISRLFLAFFCTVKI